MKKHHFFIFTSLATLGVAVSIPAFATAPCGDFGECKVLIEINATDGDIGFHFLIDGDDLNSVRLNSPDGVKTFEDSAKGPLLEQKLTETFTESAEPLCWADPEADPDETIVTLEEFVERWQAGTYLFTGKGDQGEMLTGETELTHALPAAPVAVEFDEGEISWATGDDLGNCGSNAQLAFLVAAGILPIHPVNVPVSTWEVVLEPEELPELRFSVRLPFHQTSIRVPDDYLDSLPDDTLAKIEVGAITADGNATFSEAGDLCLNEVEGCEDEED